jgi:ABC-type branched-subunit amino acid transport system ATPase component
VAATDVVMMPGGKGVFSTMTVRDNLRLTLRLQRRDKAAVADAEDRVRSARSAMRW